jgi:hypothetical protein
MKKTMYTYPQVWVALGKNRLSKTVNEKHQDVYFLEDKNEFTFEIFNPTKTTFKVVIEIEGETVTENGLVIRNGERIWLDCNVETKKRFQFSTYKVDNSSEVLDAISENGDIKVFFYEENKLNKLNKLNNNVTFLNTYFNPYYTNINSAPYCSGTIGVKGISGLHSNGTYIMQTSCCTTDNLRFNDTEIETGKIQDGSDSSQEFSYVSMNFNAIPTYTSYIKLLPLSQKMVTKEDIPTLVQEKDDFLFCTNCGNKYSIKHNFCNKCGNKLK